MSSSNHPLPTPPGSQERPAQHRTKSSFSFRSDHSKKNSNGQKIDLHETHEEKQRKRLTSKADPSMAMNEAEPSEVAKQENKLPSLRDIQHFDKNGNPIADPDRSNPTRNRWERPLDTIRAFEEAIDGNYSSRNSVLLQPGTGSNGTQYSRRSTYYGGAEERPRYPQSGYGGGRPQSFRPDSYADGRSNGTARPDSYYANESSIPSNGYVPNRARYPRTASEPHFNNAQGVYPAPGNQYSYETVTTASGSGSIDPVGYSTDPSSENSSIDRIAPFTHKPQDNYGFDGFGATPQFQPPGVGINEQYGSSGAQHQAYGQQNQGPPAVPQKGPQGGRVPIRLGESNGNAGGPPPASRPTQPEKRKSWFGKRFSKNS